LNQTARRIAVIALFTMTVPTAPALAQREECTTAVLGPTSTLSNRVVFVEEQPFAYLCLANADDPSGRRCFAGLNSEGFAIMNTVTYNLPEIAGEAKDLEGTIMADALRTCRTVEDFASYLEANRGNHLGTLANFGVIDDLSAAVQVEPDEVLHEAFQGNLDALERIVETVGIG